MFEPISYEALNSRQKENFNFHKVAARLADYGFNSLRLTDDWEGADFIACHIDGSTFVKVQLKGRLAIDKKYIGKDIHIAFIHGDNCYLYPHDIFLQQLLDLGKMGERGRQGLWDRKGIRRWPQPPAWAIDLLSQYRI